MLDPKYLKDDPENLRAILAGRGSVVDFDRLLAADGARRKLQASVDALRARKNEGATAYGRHKKAGTAESPEAIELLASMRELDQSLAAMERDQEQAETAFRDLFLLVPNIPHESVPVGAAEKEGRELRRWGKPRDFDFKPLPHYEIGEKLGILDFERASRMSGSRFTLFVGKGAALERALIQFMLDLHVREHGYTEISAPILVKGKALEGTGQLPLLANDMYRTEGNDDLWLEPTAEVPLVNIHRDEILDGERLPLKYCAYMPSFRKEAGSYGKDVRGLIRQHQFDKVEMVQFVKPEDSIAALEEMTGHAEAVLKALNLPFRTMLLCTGDMSLASHRTHDPEVWMPGQNAFREISSCSTCSDFQARRAQIRFRRDRKSKVELVHTLNGSGIAVGRAFAAVLENCQNRDTSVTIPEVLRPYMGGLESIKPG